MCPAWLEGDSTLRELVHRGDGTRGFVLAVGRGGMDQRCDTGHWLRVPGSLLRAALLAAGLPVPTDTAGGTQQAHSLLLFQENVEGPRCDQCRLGTFLLDADNPKGCTKCFCFGATDRCHSAEKYRIEVTRGWAGGSFLLCPGPQALSPKLVSSLSSALAECSYAA